MTQPLEGIRVIDMTRAMAGPYCTMMLGDLGADVIKVEQPGRGDDSRGWGPPFVGEAEGGLYPGESTYYISANRNKRSITVNLKHPEGAAIVQRLAAEADVFVENYVTGTLDRMGLGYEQLHALNPRLVYCSVSGYGRTGPYAERPGYDFVLQAEGGLMSMTGPENGEPYRVGGIPIIDITTGMFAATAIMAALRVRDRTGEGQWVDTSLLDTITALLTNMGSSYLLTGEAPRRYGNTHPSITPYEAFKARDRWFIVAAANQKQWGIVCDAVGRPELKDDPRFADNGKRVANRAELREILNAAFEVKEAGEWIELLQAAGLPCGPINTVPEVFNHPQAEAREMILTVPHPTAGEVKVAGFPYKFSLTPAEVRLAPPLLGQHTEEVLIDLLGYSAEDVKKLQKEGAV